MSQAFSAKLAATLQLKAGKLGQQIAVQPAISRGGQLLLLLQMEVLVMELSIESASNELLKEASKRANMFP